MARDMMARQLQAWLWLMGYDRRVADGFRRNAGHLRQDCVDRACAAFGGLDRASATDLSVLLGILADIVFRTYDARLDAPPEYRAPQKPLLDMWISGRFRND
jgi:hypothetical protein